MKINNKFDLKGNVIFGDYEAKVVSIIIDPDGLIYKIAYFDKDGNYRIVEVYDFEITKSKENESKIGF